MTASLADFGPIPAGLAMVYPDAVSGLTAYAGLLATAGVERGLIGPREVPRIWDRHIANCAALEQVIPLDARVADVGSGAGLPGLVLALVRPDLHVTLIEPLLRRSTFLSEVIDILGMAGRVDVARARAEDVAGAGRNPRELREGEKSLGLPVDVVTARAVASLGQLLKWCWPLLRPGGRFAVLKGQTAEAEVSDAAAELAQRGLTPADVHITALECAGSRATAVVIDRPNRQG